VQGWDGCSAAPIAHSDTHRETPQPSCEPAACRSRCRAATWSLANSSTRGRSGVSSGALRRPAESCVTQGGAPLFARGAPTAAEQGASTRNRFAPPPVPPEASWGVTWGWRCLNTHLSHSALWQQYCWEEWASSSPRSHTNTERCPRSSHAHCSSTAHNVSYSENKGRGGNQDTESERLLPMWSIETQPLSPYCC